MPKIPASFSFPQIAQGDTPRLFTWAADLIRTLQTAYSALAQGIISSLDLDGTQTMEGPLVLHSYLKTALPPAATWTGGLIYVSNEVGGAVPAFSDGTDWRRVTDRAVVS